MTKNIIILFLITLFSTTLISSKYSNNSSNQFEYEINDSTKIIVNEVFDLSSEHPLFYYSKMNIPACNTGECLLINITMFWDAFGNYYKYTVPQNTPLTKYNHRKFKKKEYIKLHKILNNRNSKYSKITIKNLTEKQATNKYKLDAISGSTIKLIYDDEKINGAVKTTHTLWHIANGNIRKILKEKTIQKLEYKNIINVNKTCFNTAVKIYHKESKEFDIDFIKSIENDITQKEMNNSILISNFLLRNNIKSKKANNLIKHINFIK